MRKILAILLFFYHFFAYSQIQDDFSDGNFTQNPNWLGDQSTFIINTAQQLQSNGPAITNTRIQLATPSRAFIGTTWEFYAKLNLATSSGNYADIFLTSDSASFKGKNSGYFVRIGGTADEVSLFRKDGAATPVIIINGRDGTMGATTNNIVKVKVSRDTNNLWTLAIDLSGTGSSYVAEGTAIDNRYQNSSYFGVHLLYSSANNQRFFFDDFRVLDNIAPQVVEIKRTAANTLDILFNEPINQNYARQVTNYSGNNGAGTPALAVVDAENDRLVHVTFSQNFSEGQTTITITNMEDIFGNRISAPLTGSFSYSPPVIANYRDIRINEIFADVSPAVGLPQAEFIELYNASAKTFNLKDWKYSDATTAAAVLPAYVLQPGKYVILSRVADTLELRNYGKVLGLTAFPTLNDSGDEVEIFDNTGKLIDKVAYTTASYKDSKKAEGGWSLELINPNTACGNIENYSAAISPDGGTPGIQNSVFNTAPDTSPPTLAIVEVVEPTKIRLIFSESLDSITARILTNYTVSGGITIVAVQVLRPNYSEVLLSLNAPLQPRQLYTISIKNIVDCPGNQANLTSAFALPEAPVAGDVVINEILFNPRSSGVDFVEIVNRSVKYVDLQNWSLGNIRADSTSDIKIITANNFMLAPGQYVVLTTRPDVVQAHYSSANPGAFFKMVSLPSFPDQEGGVLLLAPDKKEIDRFAYSEKMHFKLLDDVNGVSLERIHLNGDGSAANWHSAASTVGFATPGYKNSQYFEQTAASQLFSIEPKVFTPDGDGNKDFTTIQFQTPATGSVVNITIYNANGYEIKRLVRNETLGTNAFFRWDGLDAQGRKAAVGPYVLLIELFNLNGQVKVYKETVVVGAPF